MSTDTYAAIELLMSELRQSVIGQDAVVRALTIALLSNGNVMLEGLPGTGTTTFYQNPGPGTAGGPGQGPVHPRPVALGRHWHRGLPGVGWQADPDLPAGPNF